MPDNALQKLFDILKTLRGPDGCPWDREQSLEDILSDLIEETYELQWARSGGNTDELLDEFGDVTFVLVFALSLAQEEFPEMTLEKITAHAYNKIKRRHPHVFGDSVANTREEGLAHWNRMKAEERKNAPEKTIRSIPGKLSPIRRAEKIQEFAASENFDWPDTKGIFEKIREELAEVEAALESDSTPKRIEELGDLLFSVVNLTRFLNIDADKALSDANAKFLRRYETMQALVAEAGHTFSEMTLDQMDVYWERAKSGE